MKFQIGQVHFLFFFHSWSVERGAEVHLGIMYVNMTATETQDRDKITKKRKYYNKISFLISKT